MLELVGLAGLGMRKPRPVERRHAAARRPGPGAGHRPRVLLFDEPFSALDPLIRRDMQDEIIRLRSEVNKTMVFITHDLSEALRLGDRIAIMRDGRFVQVGTPEDVVAAAGRRLRAQLRARRPPQSMSSPVELGHGRSRHRPLRRRRARWTRRFATSCRTWPPATCPCAWSTRDGRRGRLDRPGRRAVGHRRRGLVTVRGDVTMASRRRHRSIGPPRASRRVVAGCLRSCCRCSPSPSSRSAARSATTCRRGSTPTLSRGLDEVHVDRPEPHDATGCSRGSSTRSAIASTMRAPRRAVGARSACGGPACSRSPARSAGARAAPGGGHRHRGAGRCAASSGSGTRTMITLSLMLVSVAHRAVHRHPARHLGGPVRPGREAMRGLLDTAQVMPVFVYLMPARGRFRHRRTRRPSSRR